MAKPRVKVPRIANKIAIINNGFLPKASPKGPKKNNVGTTPTEYAAYINVIASGDSANVILYNPYNGVGIVAPINRNSTANATMRNDLLFGQAS